MRPIIRARGLGKQYRIGARRASYQTLRESVTDVIRAPLRSFRRAHRPDDMIWALRDVDLDVAPGELVGLIGRNGAGKSTLLKVLTRITEPSTGSVDLFGRVGSLLEVGTGFHPELTGRENIYLNGAILGMRRREVQRRFNEIVDFAEAGKFLDTPVKRYSSGMYMRLAFAVAVHMETEIMLIDEVLAVGDAAFQKKCLEKMYQVGRQGRTILFVSHNMAAIRSICTRGLLLDRGRMVREGAINDIVDFYLAQAAQQQQGAGSVATAGFVVDNVQIVPDTGAVIKPFETVHVRIKLTAKTDIGQPGVYVGFLTLDQQRLAGLDFRDFRTATSLQAGEQTELGFTIEEFPFLPGSYQLEVYVKDMASHRVELAPQAYYFDVAETPVYGGRKLDHWFGHVGLKALAWQAEGALGEPAHQGS